MIKFSDISKLSIPRAWDANPSAKPRFCREGDTVDALVNWFDDLVYWEFENKNVNNLQKPGGSLQWTMAISAIRNKRFIFMLLPTLDSFL